MSHEFEPRQVTTRDSIAWFREALELVLRRPHFFILPVLPIVTLGFDLITFLVLYPVYYVLLFTVQLSLSEMADHSDTVQPRRIWRELKQVLTLNAALFAGMLVMQVTVLLMLEYGYTPPFADQVNLNNGPEWTQHLNELSSLAMVLLIFLQFMHGWFRHALRMFHDMPAQLARHLSRKATLINLFVIWQVAMVILLVNFLSFFAPVWIEFAIKMVILLLQPAYFYVAYRHIFLGKKHNAPVRVRQAIGAAAHTHQ